MTVCSALVPLFLTVILAFGTAAPLESVMVPPTAPSVVDCAAAVQAKITASSRARQHRTAEVPISVVLIWFSPFQSLSTLGTLVRGPDTLRGGLEGSLCCRDKRPRS